MNILKKKPFITLIFFVIALKFINTLSLRTCSSFRGVCLNSSENCSIYFSDLGHRRNLSENCSGTIKNSTYLCGFNTICCVPSGPTKCILDGGKCINSSDNCDSGYLMFDICGPNKKCCLPKKNPTNTSVSPTIKSDKQTILKQKIDSMRVLSCDQKRGVCMNSANQCNGATDNNLCGPNRKCCLPKSTTTTSVKRTSSKKSITTTSVKRTGSTPRPAAKSCNQRGGKCINKSNHCSGLTKHNLCGPNRKCCLPKLNSNTSVKRTSSKKSTTTTSVKRNSSKKSTTTTSVKRTSSKKSTTTTSVKRTGSTPRPAAKSCEQRRGKCVNKSDYCNGPTINNICGSDKRCCLPKRKGPLTKKQPIY